MRWWATIASSWLALGCTCSDGRAQDAWQFSNRLQVGGEHDDNIYESSRRPTAAYSGRLLVRSRAEREWSRVQLSLAYSGGLQTYYSFSDENKLTNEGGADLQWRVNRWCRLSGAVQGTLKIYLNGPFDYGTTQSSLQATLQLPRQWLLTMSVASLRLDYAESDAFDYLGRTYGLSVRHPLLGSLVGEAGAQGAALRYLRAVTYQGANFQWVSGGTSQRDRQSSAFVRLMLGRRFVVHVTGEFQHNASNSLGYDYERWRLSLLTAFRVAPRWMVRVAALRQHKKYTEDLPPIFPIELDTERNESNFLVGDLSFDLSSDFVWLARVAYYDNEAAVRGLFYQKTLWFSGLEYRF